MEQVFLPIILLPYLTPTRSVTETLYKCHHRTTKLVYQHHKTYPNYINHIFNMHSFVVILCKEDSYMHSFKKLPQNIRTCLAKLSRVESLFIATAICPMQLVMFGGHHKESDVIVSERDWFRASSPCERASSASCVDCCNPHIPSICCSVRGSI